MKQKGLMTLTRLEKLVTPPDYYLAVETRISEFWHKLYQAQYAFYAWRHQNANRIFLLLLTIWLWVSYLVHARLSSYILAKNIALPYEDISAMFVALGGALIGASAIVFSFVMFTMQVNIERLPHGMFRRVSEDPKLMGAFAANVFASLLIILFSLVPRMFALSALMVSAWFVTIIFLLYLYAYKRALKLVNPAFQVQLIVRHADKVAKEFERKIKRMLPLVGPPKQAEEESPFTSTKDERRFVFLQAQQNWTHDLVKATNDVVSFSRSYVERGDYEVSGLALGALVNINQIYIRVKGKTFFASNGLIDHPLTTDGFINKTLEHLRINIQSASARKDEQQFIQSLRVMKGLFDAYMRIDYGDKFSSPSHANLAAGYLGDAVGKAAANNMPDVLMEGFRLIGAISISYITYRHPDDMVPVLDKMAPIAAVASTTELLRPATMVAMEQFSKLTLLLLAFETPNTDYALKKTREKVDLVTRVMLAVPDPVRSIHQYYLAPYYSSTDVTGLQRQLGELANQIIDKKISEERAKIIVRNFISWSEELYQNQKEMLLKALEADSWMAYEIIHWIGHVSEILLALANAEMVDDYCRDELSKNALWLFSVLSWLPDDKKSVQVLETYHLSDVYFDTIAEGYRFSANEFCEEAEKLYSNWIFKAGLHQTGWAILERGLIGIAALSLLPSSPIFIARIKSRIKAEVEKPGAPKELFDKVACGLREEAQKLRSREFLISKRDCIIAELDRMKFNSLLSELADILSPDTKGSPVGPRELF